MDAKSVSSASKSASSALSSGGSQAASAASKASATLSSSSSKASAFAQGAVGETDVKSASIFALTPFTFSILAATLGAAYYYGYLDDIIAYLQQLMGQAQDKKERTLKENTGQTSVRAAVKGQYEAAAAKTQDTVNNLQTETQRQTEISPSVNTPGLFSNEAKA